MPMFGKQYPWWHHFQHPDQYPAEAVALNPHTDLPLLFYTDLFNDEDEFRVEYAMDHLYLVGAIPWFVELWFNK